MYSNRAQFEIGRRIREVRHSQDATQQQFAEDIYITPNFLSEIENGKKTLLRIQKGFRRLSAFWRF